MVGGTRSTLIKGHHRAIGISSRYFSSRQLDRRSTRPSSDPRSLSSVIAPLRAFQHTMRRNRIHYVVFLAHLVLLFDLALSKNEYTKLFDKCAREKNAFDCLKRRALDILDSGIRDDTVYVLNDYVSIGRDPAAAAKGVDRSFKDENGTELSLDQKLDNKFHEYISSRSVKLTIPGDAFQGTESRMITFACLRVIRIATFLFFSSRKFFSLFRSKKEGQRIRRSDNGGPGGGR